MKVWGIDCSIDKKRFGCQFNDTEFNKKINENVRGIRSKYADQYGNIKSLVFLKYNEILFEKEVTYIQHTSSGPQPNLRVYYIIFDETTQMYFLVSFYKPYHDSRWSGYPHSSYNIHLIIDSPKYDFDVMKHYFSIKFHNFNYKTETIHHEAEIDNFYKAVLEAFQYLNLIYNFESSTKKIKELEHLSKENIQIKKSLTSKVKLIEELKKNCKTTIVNSLSGKTKKSFHNTNTLLEEKLKQSYEKIKLLTKELAIADKTIEELSQPLRELINGVKSLNKRKSRKNKNLNN